MSAITTHVLDTSLGRPAAGLPVRLEFQLASGEWKLLDEGATDLDGRLAALLTPGVPLSPGTYRLTFDTHAYFRARNLEGFYPQVQVLFTVRDAAQHHHVPLLLSPYGYATYRGS